MAITAANKIQNGSAAGATSYATASVSPLANRLYLLTVGSLGPSVVNTPTVTGASMTWTQVVTKVQAGNTRRITIFRALNAVGGSGALTIDFAGQSQTNCNWALDEFQGMWLEGTNGDAAIVQTAGNDNTGTNTGITVTLGAFRNVRNAVYAGVRASPATVVVTKKSTFTELSNFTPASGGVLETEFLASNDTTPNWTWPSASVNIVAVAVEIAAACGPAPHFTRRAMAGGMAAPRGGLV